MYGLAFFMLKRVGGVSSNFGPVTFCTAADDFLLSHLVFAAPWSSFDSNWLHRLAHLHVVHV